MKETKSQKYRRLRYKRRLCYRCPNARRPDSKGCEVCAEKDKNRFEAQVAQGLCRQCKGPREDKSSVKCYNCNIKARINRLKKLGLNEREIEKAHAALRKHDGSCDSCGTKIPGGRGEWSLDHKDKKFRGILCCGCNSAIGHVKDDPKKLEAAAKYLRKRRSSDEDSI